MSFGRKILLWAATAAAARVPVAIAQVAREQPPPVAAASSPHSGQGAATFGVATVKSSGPGGESSQVPACGGYRLLINPGRFTATNASLYKLVTWAYGIRYDCHIVSAADLLSGGPKWILSDRFDIQATIPAGTAEYTPQQFLDGAAPELQAMLRSLLEERFKVALHRGTKEMGVYVLSLTSGGPKLAPPDGDKPRRLTMRLEPDENKDTIVHVLGNKASMADFTHLIEPVTGIPVLDRTGLTGEYSFDVKFAVLEPFSGSLVDIYGVGATGPSIFSVLQGQLGLKLARSRGSVDAWVVDHAEKPSDN